jgi:hypothetical protein
VVAHADDAQRVAGNSVLAARALVLRAFLPMSPVLRLFSGKLPDQLPALSVAASARLR